MDSCGVFQAFMLGPLLIPVFSLFILLFPVDITYFHFACFEQCFVCFVTSTQVIKKQNGVIPPLMAVWHRCALNHGTFF